MESYNIVIVDGNMVGCITINADMDLIQKYKDAKINENKFFAWDKGCLSMDRVVGVYKF